jgi:hypothetical protein
MHIADTLQMTLCFFVSRSNRCDTLPELVVFDVISLPLYLCCVGSWLRVAKTEARLGGLPNL